MERRRVIGHRVIQLDSVDSTNRYAALGIARHELEHGTAIMALEQTAGHGQRGRAWSTLPGMDLATSVVLLPVAMAASDQFLLARMAALTMYDVVADCLGRPELNGNEVRIKWPNDILVGRKKVAGILIENELKGPWISSAVVGIGLNVNSTGWPEAYRATSLSQLTRTTHAIEEVLERALVRMEHWWQEMTTSPARLTEAYATKLWALGRFAEFSLDGRPFTARPLDVDASGRLLVEAESGAVAAYGLERLRFVR